MAEGYLGPPRLRGLLGSRRTLIGVWVTVRDPLFVEQIAYGGYDLILIDVEHTPITISELALMLVAIQGSPAVPLVRMTGNDVIAVKQVLDLGVEGIIVPMVNSAAEARQLASYGQYPPAGVRGINPRRAMHLTGGGPWEYMRRSGEIVCRIPQIEHINAVNEIDEICSIPGIDGLFVGPSDLSLSLGLPGEFSHPDVVAARDRVWEASRRHKLPFATATTGRDDAIRWIERGAEMVFAGSDINLLLGGMKSEIETLRKVRGN